MAKGGNERIYFVRVMGNDLPGPKITAFQSIIFSGRGLPEIPPGGSVERRLKSRISLRRAVVDYWWRVNWAGKGKSNSYNIPFFNCWMMGKVQGWQVKNGRKWVVCWRMIEIKSRIQVEVNEALENGTLQIGLSVMRQPRGEKNEYTKYYFYYVLFPLVYWSFLGSYIYISTQNVSLGFPQDVLIGKWVEIAHGYTVENVQQGCFSKLSYLIIY